MRLLKQLMLTLTILLPVLGMSTSCAQTAAPAPATATAAPAPAPGVDTSYTLAAGDRLRIIVFGEDRLSGEYSVTNAGEISFPLIGNVPVQGKTQGEVQTLLHDRLAAGYLRDPRVSIEVMNYRPFFILGEVARPGQYPYATGLTVQQAVATAGGFSYRANTKRVFIKRALETEEKRIALDKEPVPVFPGDVVRIGERFF